MVLAAVQKYSSNSKSEIVMICGTLQPMRAKVGGERHRKGGEDFLLSDSLEFSRGETTPSLQSTFK